MNEEIDLPLAGYEHAAVVGHGGFAVVYRASQTDVGRLVAIKILTGVFDERAALRFDRELGALGRLSGHPNCVTVHSSGLLDDGRPYIVMEYLDEGSLADALTRGPMPWARGIEMAVKLSGALEAAHRAGVLHRDIKPENILVSAYGEPKLADFGVARLADAPETRTGSITASLYHAAPEVLGGARPSAASDVYSLASTTFALIAGVPAFRSETDDSIVVLFARIANSPVPDLRAGVPAPVCEVLEAGMAKEPSSRIATAAEFGRRLQAAQRELGLPVTQMVGSADTPRPAATGRPEATRGERAPSGVTDSVPDVARTRSARLPVTTAVESGRLGASYRLLERIGSGGMGDVYRAEGPRGPVAVKILRAELAEDDDAVGRFLQEREILIGLRSPHLVEVYDMVVEGDRLGIVMELADGSDLRALLQRGPLAPAVAVDLTAQILDGVSAAHRAGVVHRDLKPENVLLRRQADELVAKVVDFGVARVLGRHGSGLTGLIGTPRYLAPELIEGLAVTPAADVYSAGIMFHELLVGSPPFVFDDSAAVMHAHVRAPIVRPEGIPDPVWAVLDRMVAKDPPLRPTAAEAAAELGTLAGPLRGLAPLPQVRGADPDAPTLAPRPPGTQPNATVAFSGDRPPVDPEASGSWTARSAPWVALVVLALVVLLAGGAWWLLRDDGAATSRAPAACVAGTPVAAIPRPADLPEHVFLYARPNGKLHVGQFLGDLFVGWPSDEEATAMSTSGIATAGPDREITWDRYLALGRTPTDGLIAREWAPRSPGEPVRYLMAAGGAFLPVRDADTLAGSPNLSTAISVPRQAFDGSRYLVPRDGTVVHVAGNADSWLVRGGRRHLMPNCSPPGAVTVPNSTGILARIPRSGG